MSGLVVSRFMCIKVQQTQTSADPNPPKRSNSVIIFPFSPRRFCLFFLFDSSGAYFSSADDINILCFATNQARLRERPWVFDIDRYIRE